MSALQIGMPIAVMRKFDKVNDRRSWDPKVQVASFNEPIDFGKMEPIAIIITRGNLIGRIMSKQKETNYHYGDVQTIDGLLSWDIETGNYVYTGQPPSEVGHHQYDIKEYYWDIDDAIPQALLKGTIQPGERFKP